MLQFVHTRGMLRDFRCWFQLAEPNSYLVHAGWIRSRREWCSVDAQGEPLPWLTYPSISFLGERMTSAMRVFEYGAGQSTLWFAKRAKDVWSCEANEAWYWRMRATAPDNVTLLLAPKEDIPKMIAQAPGLFDIILIDGARRQSSFFEAHRRLQPGGVIIWDNSDRTVAEDGPDRCAMKALGFRELPFVGTGPINIYEWQTSIFYRPQNCLGI